MIWLKTVDPFETYYYVQVVSTTYDEKIDIVA